MPDPAAIEATALTKSYGRTPVLGGIDLSISRGSVFALLGPNGAGKTTTVRILATLTSPDGGSARVCGFDVLCERGGVRARISLTGQDATLDDLQTGTENLLMMARLRRLPGSTARERVGELLERFDLVDAADRRLATYSGGMRRRLDLAAGLVVRPEVIFLDEPTTGLDPRSRQAVWDIVAELAASGVTILLTTQYLEEADQLADRIAVIDDGRIVAEGTAAELKSRVAGRRLDLRLADQNAYDAIRTRLGQRVTHSERSALTLGVPVDDGAPAVRHLIDDVDPGRERILDFTVHTASLDDVFMTLTGHHAAGGDARTSDDRNSDDRADDDPRKEPIDV